MRILLLAFFFGIKHIFSKDTSASGNDGKLKLYGSKFNHLSSRDTYEQYSRTWDGENVKDFLEHLDLILTQNIKKRDHLYPKDSSLQEDSRISQRDIDAVPYALVSYLKRDFSKTNCENTLANYCDNLQSLLNKSKAADAMDKACSEKEKQCLKALEYLKEICKEIKKEQEALNCFSEAVCLKHLKKCDDLEPNCNGTLTQSCKKVKEECSKLCALPSKPKPSDNEFVLTHTVLTTTTVTETKLAETIETYLQTFIKTKVCCHCKAAPTKIPSIPLEPPEPEEEESEEEEPEKEPETGPGKELDEEELEEPEEKPEEEPEEEPEEPEEVPEEKPDDDDCTITVTVTGTPQVEQCKDHGIRLEGLRKAVLIYVIIGIMTGVWIIV